MLPDGQRPAHPVQRWALCCVGVYVVRGYPTRVCPSKDPDLIASKHTIVHSLVPPSMSATVCTCALSTSLLSLFLAHAQPLNTDPMIQSCHQPCQTQGRQRGWGSRARQTLQVPKHAHVSTGERQKWRGEHENRQTLAFESGWNINMYDDYYESMITTSQ